MNTQFNLLSTKEQIQFNTIHSLDNLITENDTLVTRLQNTLSTEGNINNNSLSTVINSIRSNMILIDAHVTILESTIKY